jgi:ribosomal protein S18 acetylase RimI-like enzyme
MSVRRARIGDEGPLLALDQATWSTEISPAPWPAGPFFDERTRPEDVLLAEEGGAVVGYVLLGPATRLASNAHVVQIHGLAVAPAARRHGTGRALLQAAAAEAERRGATRLTLRVLGTNEGARALYAGMGFVVEGIQRDEFRLGDRYVDDVLMALSLGGGEEVT